MNLGTNGQIITVSGAATVMEESLRTIHLRYGIILTDHKHNRFIIARSDTVDYPLVFHRVEEYDPEFG